MALKKNLVNVILLFVLILTWASEGRAQVRKLIRVFITDPGQVEQILSYNLDFASHRIRRYADVVVTEEEGRFLIQQGFTFEILIDDLRRSFEQRFAGLLDMGAYHTYQEMYEEMLEISNNYPEIAMLTSIGQSIEGREIWAMKVSDNPTLEEDDEPDLLYMANMHAREVVTPEVILYFLNYLVDNYGSDPEVTELVDNREFWFIPTQNPDGHVYVEQVNPLWRKNRRHNGGGIFGVDLNRNYSYMWGFDNVGSSPNPGSETYRGTGPFSEPESEAVRQLCLSHNFVLALSYHSYGSLWLFPWGYVPENTPHHPVFLELANNCVAFNGYTPGNPASGTIYLTNGDSDDYFYGEQEEKGIVFSFTPEVGDEFWPPESQIQILAEENLGANLYLARVAPIIADNPLRILGPATPVIEPISEVVEGSYVLNWSIEDDPDNPAILYQLDELSGFAAITDDAEDGDTNWHLNGFSFSSTRFKSGVLSFYSGPGNNLNRNMTTAVPMIVDDSGELTFWTWYDIEFHSDYAYVEISTDGGSTFTSIPGNITTNSNPNGNNQGNGITGSSGGWIQASFDLSDFVAKTILMRFRYVSDALISEEGFYVDDIAPVPTYETMLTLNDAIPETMYEVSEREDGVYYYQVRAQDAEEQWGGWSALEDVVVEAVTVGGQVVAQANCPSQFMQNCAINLPVTIDVTGTLPTVPLGSYNAVLTWDPAFLEYVGFSGGDPPFDTPIVNEDNTTTGELQFEQFDPRGAEDVVNIINVDFNVVGDPASRGILDLEFSQITAAGTQNDLLSITTIEDCGFEIAPDCLLGDVTLDDLPSGFGALVIASFAVDLPIPPEFLARIEHGCGDVTLDGNTSGFDALVIATFAVDLPIPDEFPVGEPLCP